ncbi:MAG TPA: DUF2946 family protein [Sphingobium sp.]|uniref:DUF2946 family protein n=1 Tax=Sphingobium sp. TaxID=1912891 RepID=UPI002ED558BA
MTGAIRQSDMLRALFGVLVVFVLAARLLAPAGFMPVVTSHGVMVTLCTGQGAMKVLVDRENLPESRLAKADGSHGDSDDGMAKEHCPFAGVATAPSLPAQDVVPVLAVWHLPTGPIAFALKTGWIARIAAPPPPSSGPPHLLA